MVERASAETLKNIITQVEDLIATTTPLPENRTPRCLELLRAAKALAEDLGRESVTKH